MISFKKTAYSNQLIYTKQLIRISFLKNNLFETTYLCKTAYYDLIFKKQLIRNNLFMQNSLLRSHF